MILSEVLKVSVILVLGLSNKIVLFCGKAGHIEEEGLDDQKEGGLSGSAVIVASEWRAGNTGGTP